MPKVTITVECDKIDGIADVLARQLASMKIDSRSEKQRKESYKKDGYCTAINVSGPRKGLKCANPKAPNYAICTRHLMYEDKYNVTLDKVTD